MLDVLSVRWLLLGGLPLKFSLKYLQPYCIQLPSDSFVCWESMKGWTVERVVLLRLQINSRAFLFQSLRGNTWLVRDTHARKILARSTAYCAWIIINSSRVTHTHPRHGGFLGIHKSCCEIHVFSPREIWLVRNTCAPSTYVSPLSKVRVKLVRVIAWTSIQDTRALFCVFSRQQTFLTETFLQRSCNVWFMMPGASAEKIACSLFWAY